MSLRDEVFALDDLTKEPVEVERWKKTIWVREMTADDYDLWLAELRKRKITDTGELNQVGIRSWLVVRLAVDELGERVFEDSDADRLARKNGAAVNQLFDAAAKLNGLLKDDAAKNSEASPSETSA